MTELNFTFSYNTFILARLILTVVTVPTYPCPPSWFVSLFQSGPLTTLTPFCTFSVSTIEQNMDNAHVRDMKFAHVLYLR